MAEIVQPLLCAARRTNMGMNGLKRRELCKLPSDHINRIDRSINFAQSPCHFNPVRHHFSGLFQLCILSASAGNLTVTDRSRHGQQQQISGVPPRVIHAQEAHDFSAYHNRSSHQAICPLKFQHHTGFRIGFVVHRRRRKEKLSLFPKPCKPLLQPIQRDVLLVSHFRSDTFATPLTRIAGIGIFFIYLKNI